MQRYLQPFYAAFPLVTYSERNAAQAPAQPTLWTFSSEHSDLDCLQIQTALRLAGVQHTALVLDVDDGAVGGQLPNLHLPSGALLQRDEIIEWIQSQSNFKADLPDSIAWVTLLDQTLVPAIVGLVKISPKSKADDWQMAALFTEPLFSASTRDLYHPKASDGSLLSRYAHSWKARERKARQLDAVRLKAGAAKAQTLLVEDLENAAKQTLEAANAMLASASGSKWLLSTDEPTLADAVLFACLKAIQQLPDTPSQGQHQFLRRLLEREACSALRKWYTTVQDG